MAYSVRTTSNPVTFERFNAEVERLGLNAYNNKNGHFQVRSRNKNHRRVISWCPNSQKGTVHMTLPDRTIRGVRTMGHFLGILESNHPDKV